MCTTTRRRRAAAAVPAPLTTFQIRLHAIGGHCPITGQPLPTLEGEFDVQASDRAAAARRSKVFMTLPLRGQLLRTYVDGVEELATA